MYCTPVLCTASHTPVPQGLSYMESTDTFLALRESFEHDEHGLVPLTVEVQVEASGDKHKVGA